MEIYENLSIESLPNEEWMDVVGYEGLYQVRKDIKTILVSWIFKGKTTCQTQKGDILCSSSCSWFFCWYR